jgi:hypothetical protein
LGAPGKLFVGDVGIRPITGIPGCDFSAVAEVFFACAGHYCVCVRLQVGRSDEFLHGRQDGEIHFRLRIRWCWQGGLSQLPPRGRILERHPDGGSAFITGNFRAL